MTHAKWVSGRPDRDTSRIIAPQIVSPSVFLRPGNGLPESHTSSYSRSVGTGNSTGPSLAPGGNTVPPACSSRHCNGPWMPLTDTAPGSTLYVPPRCGVISVLRSTSKMTAVDHPNNSTPFIAVIGPSRCQRSIGVTSP